MIRFVRYEKIPMDELEVFPGNPNVGDVPRILESLQASGAFRSLIVREHEGRTTVMAGNHTKLAMVEHGVGLCQRQIKHDSDPDNTDPCGLCLGTPEGFDGKPRCEIYECSDEEAARINIADNRIPEFSHRDDQSVADLLLAMEDLTGTGYTADDLRLFLPQEPEIPETTHVEFDAATAEPDPDVVMSFKVPASVRDHFMDLSGDAPDPEDPSSRFLYILSRFPSGS